MTLEKKPNKYLQFAVLGLLLVGILVWFTIIVVQWDGGLSFSAWVSIGAICLAILFLAQIPLFHSNLSSVGA